MSTPTPNSKDVPASQTVPLSAEELALIDADAPVGSAPAGTPAGKPGRSGRASSPISAGMWIALIVSALLLVLLLVFIVQNNVPVDIKYFGWQFSLPLGVTVLASAIAGILIAGIIGSVRIFIIGRANRQAKRQAKRSSTN